jgi:hypothetical protein
MNTEVEYAIGNFMRVRKLAGLYQINDSWLVGGARHKRRRYKLYPVKGTGAILDVTEAYGDDLQPAPSPAAPEELSLVPEPQELSGDVPGYSSAMLAPDAEHAAPDAIRSPERTFTPGQAFGLDEGAFGGEPDPYSIGANLPDEPGELRFPYKPVRKFPGLPTYRELRGIVYNASFKGMEKINHKQLENGTPVAVVVTHETNGHAIWVITIETPEFNQDAERERRARLEVFYPNAPGSSADAIEYAVLLALRQIPIRADDLEILLLQLR